MSNKYEVIHTSCTCQNDYIVRPSGTHETWKYGPKCAACGNIVRDWQVIAQDIEASSRGEALDIALEQGDLRSGGYIH